MSQPASDLVRIAAAARQRQRRQRVRADIKVVPVDITFDVRDALISAGKLAGWNEDDKRALGAAAAEALCEWARLSQRDTAEDGDELQCADNSEVDLDENG